MPKWGARTRLPSPFWFLRQTKLLVPAFDGATTPCRTLLFCSADRAGGVGSAEPVFQQPLAAGGCGSRGSGHAHQDLLSACTFVFTEVSLSPRSSASRSFQDISLLRGWTTDGACESRPTLYLRAARACFPWPTRVSSCVDASSLPEQPPCRLCQGRPRRGTPAPGLGNSRGLSATRSHSP